MGVSLEVVSSWIRNCTEAKQLDKLLSLVERQRVVLQAKQTAKAAKQRADMTGHDGA